MFIAENRKPVFNQNLKECFRDAMNKKTEFVRLEDGYYSGELISASYGMAKTKAGLDLNCFNLILKLNSPEWMVGTNYRISYNLDLSQLYWRIKQLLSNCGANLNENPIELDELEQFFVHFIGSTLHFSVKNNGKYENATVLKCETGNKTTIEVSDDIPF